MSKVTNTIHLVFATKNRLTTIPTELRRDVYNVMYRMLEDLSCHVYRINGTSNHVHILFALHPSTALADLVARLKSKSSHWMKLDGRFIYFEGWCREYFAESVGTRDIETVKQYIYNQEGHHGLYTLEDEMTTLYNRNNWIFKPEYFN